MTAAVGNGTVEPDCSSARPTDVKKSEPSESGRPGPADFDDAGATADAEFAWLKELLSDVGEIDAGRREEAIAVALAHFDSAQPKRRRHLRGAQRRSRRRAAGVAAALTAVAAVFMLNLGVGSQDMSPAAEEQAESSEASIGQSDAMLGSSERTGADGSIASGGEADTAIRAESFPADDPTGNSGGEASANSAVGDSPFDAGPSGSAPSGSEPVGSEPVGGEPVGEPSPVCEFLLGDANSSWAGVFDTVFTRMFERAAALWCN